MRWNRLSELPKTNVIPSCLCEPRKPGVLWFAKTLTANEINNLCGVHNLWNCIAPRGRVNCERVVDDAGAAAGMIRLGNIRSVDDFVAARASVINDTQP